MNTKDEIQEFRKDTRIRDFMLLVIVFGLVLFNSIHISNNFRVSDSNRTRAMQQRRESDIYLWSLLNSLGAKTNLPEPKPYVDQESPDSSK